MEESRQLLVVSDNDDSMAWTDCLATSGLSLVRVDSINAGLSALNRDTHPAAILDFTNFTPQLLHEQLNLHPEVAFIPVLQSDDTDTLLDCFRMGCFDVMVRPVSERQLKKVAAHVQQFKNNSSRESVYRAKLEVANRELKDSLKILEMDQIAGRQVQLSMLPDRKKRFDDYEIAYEIIPSLYLSGDFVGYNVVFDRYLLFYIADVSGHGASSAFITVMLRFILNRIVRRHITENDIAALARAPKGFLEHINRQILGLDVDKHMTIFAASIDMQQNILRYSVGAHMPTPIFMTEGDARFLPGKGKPVGIFENVTWEVQEIVLPKKFIMTATSDGVLEFVSGDSLSDKLATMIDAVAESDYSIHSICDKLGIGGVEDVPDDVTVLTVRRGL